MIELWVTRKISPSPSFQRGVNPDHVEIEMDVAKNQIDRSTASRLKEKSRRRHNLADFLRHDLALTGTHVGCEHGVCGSCTVQYNGAPVRSCLMLAVQADRSEITTVEGLARTDALGPLQQAFKKHHALQCGFCTPGFLMTADALLRNSGPLTDAEVRQAVSGNLCRCTGYQNIVNAIVEASGGESLRAQARS